MDCVLSPARNPRISQTASYLPDRLDRFALHLIERSAKDAYTIAKSGSFANQPLAWLAETGLTWCEIYGGAVYRDKLQMLIGEIKRIEVAARKGQRLAPTSPVLLARRRNQKTTGDECQN